MKAIFIFFVLALAVNLQLSSAEKKYNPRRPCGFFEHYLEIATACEPTCEKPYVPECIELKHFDVCRCFKGLVRLAERVCVSREACPNYPDTTNRPPPGWVPLS